MFVVPRFGSDVWLSLFAVTAALAMFFYVQGRGQKPGLWPFLESVAGTYLSCLICLMGSVFVWRHVLPRLVKRPLAVGPWITLHVVSAMLASAVVAWFASPVMFAIHPKMGSSSLRFTLISAAIGALFATPMVAIFRLRHDRRKVESQLADERQRRLEAQLNALQARTSPHFLFNTLNSIASLIPRDPELAELTLERMSNLFRYSLESGSNTEVPLAREVEAVEAYLAIQKTRFTNRFCWTMNVEKGLEVVSVPPLFLQPLVENAVVHGVSRRLNGGTISVVIATEPDGRLRCTVRDNGSSITGKHVNGSGTAVEDLRARLALRYGDEASLATEPRDDGGYCSTVILPRAKAA